VRTTLNEEQCSVRSVCSMIMHEENDTVFICDCTGKTIAGKSAERREREKGERVRDRALQKKGLVSVINLTIGQISYGLEVDNLLELIPVLSRWQLGLSNNVNGSCYHRPHRYDFSSTVQLGIMPHSA
jgi:hypothetical protein